MDNIVEQAYAIAESNGAILKGNIVISGDVNCLLFAYYCDDTLFYKSLIRSTKAGLQVNKRSKKALKEIKKLIKGYGYRKVWTKGIFSVYGDLRSLAVKAGFGEWGDSGIIVNEKYGSNFLLTAVYYR